MASKIDPAVDKELKALDKRISVLDKKFTDLFNERGKRNTEMHNKLVNTIHELDKKLVAAINARH